MTKKALHYSLWGKTHSAKRRMQKIRQGIWCCLDYEGLPRHVCRRSAMGNSWEPLYWATEKLKELEMLPSLHAKWETAVENLSLLPHKEGGFSQFTHLTRNEWSRKIFMEALRWNFKGKGHNHQCHWQEDRRRRNSPFGERFWEPCRDLLVDDQHILSLLLALFFRFGIYMGS